MAAGLVTPAFVLAQWPFPHGVGLKVSAESPANGCDIVLDGRPARARCMAVMAVAQHALRVALRSFVVWKMWKPSESKQ